MNCRTIPPLEGCLLRRSQSRRLQPLPDLRARLSLTRLPQYCVTDGTWRKHVGLLAQALCHFSEALFKRLNLLETATLHALLLPVEEDGSARAISSPIEAKYRAVMPG